MTLMRQVLALGVLSASLCAQAVEIPSLTIVSTRVDADRLNNGAAGTTTLQAIRVAGAPYVAQISAFTLTPNTAAQGYYNWNLGGGNGIGLNPTTNQLSTIPPASFFNAFDLTIDFELETTEFGFSVGDWSGGMDIEFRRAADNSLVATHRSSLFTTVDTKFFQTAVEFDRVVIKADSETANWVLTDLHVPASEPWVAFGQGCSGVAGVPVLGSITAPTLGDPFSLSLSNLDPAGGAYLMVLGFSVESDPALGSLPIELTPIGAPGCSLLCSSEAIFFQAQTTGASQFDIAVPNNQVLLGLQVMTQAFTTDSSNALGLVATNAGIGTINL
jgi:hypothetical protein